MKEALQVIDSWLRYQEAQRVLPGFQVSIRKQGKLIFSKAYGYSNLNSKSKYTPSLNGRIASQSKVFTAAIALWLESQGLVRLDDAVEKWIPELRLHKDSRFKKIRLVDLLSHRSGIGRDSLEVDYWGQRKGFPTRHKLLAEVSKRRLVYRPGLLTKYSNTNFALVGVALENITQMSFELLLQKFLKSISFQENVTSDFHRANGLAQGYIRRQLKGPKFRAEPHRQTLALSAAAGFCANCTGTSDFFSRLYQDKSILPRAQSRRLLVDNWPVTNVKTDNYGLGTIFSKVHGRSYIGHSGGFPGFSSQTWVVPSLGCTFSFMGNASITKSFDAIRSMADILQAFEDHFEPNEMKNLIVSPPMADHYISTIYAVGKSRALAFPLSGWLPTENLSVFEKRAGAYYSGKISGYHILGEPLKFETKAGRISAVHIAGFKSLPIWR